MDLRSRNLVRAASDATVQSPFSDNTPPSMSPAPTPADSPPSSSPAPRSAKLAKKSNPLIDLIETEKQYVDLLASIIRRVAAAWSKDNFPPRELDAMFRSIEAIYKANRSLLTRLKEIGPSPSSPKALGDLLMRWIDDLEEPYQRYCNSYLTGFDSWRPVQQNLKLHGLLGEVTAALPPIGSTLDSTEPRTAWTLDGLFLLPRGRLKYYKRLYARLLKSTQPGRSDHRLLVVAVEKLDHLLDLVGNRLQLRLEEQSHSVGSSKSASPSPSLVLADNAPQEFEMSRTLPPLPADERDLPPPPPPVPEPPHPVHSRKATPALPPPPENVERKLPAKPPDEPRESLVVAFPGTGGVLGLSSTSIRHHVSLAETSPGDRGSSNITTPDDSHSEGRSSRGTNSTSIGSLGNLPSPSDLERSLSVDNVHDIFTMTVKACSLQLSPAELPFARSTRASVDLSVTCTPVTTGVAVTTERGHVFLLSDLLLICEKLNDDDRVNADGPTMRLVYPPLAGRFIKVTGDSSDKRNTLTVQLLRKVTITFHAESQNIKDRFQKDLEDCVAFASKLPSAKGGKPRPSADPITPITPTEAPPFLPRSNSEPFVTESLPKSKSADVAGPLRAVELRDGPPSLAQPVSHTSLPPIPSSNGNLTISINGPRSYDGAVSPNPPQRPSPHMMPPQGPPHQHSFPPGPGGPLMPGYGHPPNYFPPGSADFRGRDGGPGGPPFPPDRFGPPPHGPSRPFPPPNFGPGPAPFPPGHATGAPRDFSSYPSPTASSMPPSTRTTILSSRSPSLASSHPSTRRPIEDISPPSSPGEEKGPVTAVISAQMKCKVFLKQAHSQWKSLGGAKLKLYQQQPTNVKQLVVEADTREKTLLISTIVLTDAVERVGKTGVAIELSDQGASTGIVYMIQLRNETSATGLFNSLLMGSDRTTSG